MFVSSIPHAIHLFTFESSVHTIISSSGSSSRILPKVSSCGYSCMLKSVTRTVYWNNFPSSYNHINLSIRLGGRENALIIFSTYRPSPPDNIILHPRPSHCQQGVIHNHQDNRNGMIHLFHLLYKMTNNDLDARCLFYYHILNKLIIYFHILWQTNLVRSK